MTKVKFYKTLIKEALEVDELTIEQAYKRFLTEKTGRGYDALKDWLQGLAISIPYMNHDILVAAYELGLHSESTRETTKDNLIESYWDDIALVLYSSFCNLNK